MAHSKPSTKGDGGCFSLLSCCFRTQQKDQHLPLENQKLATGAAISPAEQSQLATSPSRLSPISSAIGPKDLEGTKDLWQEAFDQLGNTSEKKSVNANVSPSCEKFDINELIGLIESHEEKFKEKSVKITIGNQDIFWRDCAKRTVSCIKSCGDIAMPFAPAPSSIVWSAVKVLLDAHVGQCEHLIAILGCAEKALRLEQSVAQNQEVQERLQSLQERICYLDTGVSEILGNIEDQKMREALNYISDIHFGNQHLERTKTRTEGTGKWLLKDETFCEWENTSSSALLWLKGYAGAGKSTLASHVVDRYRNNDRRNNVPIDEGFAFFYFRKTDQDDGDRMLNVLRSFVRQLAIIPNHPKKMVAFLIKRYQDMEKIKQPFDKKLCEESLLQLVHLLPRTVIVLDGLDEFDKEDMKTIMETMVKLLKESRRPLKMFISSRDRSDIRSSLSNAGSMLATIAIADKNEPDIEKFVKQRVKEIGEDWGQEVRDEVEKRLCTESGGMFRWAFLQVEQLKELGSDDAVMNRIGRLSKDLEQAYDELYKKDDPVDQMYLKRAVQWTMHAFQPLTTEELLAAVRFETSDNNGCIELRTLGSLSERQLETLCRYLIVKDVEGNWKFPHASVQEYFLDKHEGWAGQTGKAEMAKLSLLLVRKANREHQDHGFAITTGSESIAADPVGSLRMYVSQYWFSYVKTIQFDIEQYPKISQLLQHFMVDGEEQYQNWTEYYPETRPDSWTGVIMMGDLQPTDMTVLGLVVLGILPAAMQWGRDLLEAKLEFTNENGYSILSLAAKYGHDSLCSQLIGLGSDINKIIDGGDSALQQALKKGNKTCAVTLLEHGADPNLGTDRHSLCDVIMHCYDKELLDLLLDKGANPEALCRICAWNCALMAAAARGNTEAAVALMDAGARVDFPGGELGTPLLQAARSGSLKIAKLLISCEADVNIRTGEKYGGVLAAAFAHGRSEVLTYLIEEANADPYRMISDLAAKKPVVTDLYRKERKEMAIYLFTSHHLEVNDSRLQEIVNMPELRIAEPLREIIEIAKQNRARK
ncbi:ankyrin repeat [Fusarium sporotrichioides]|uniref:Ankyrin repeat n=1 Tax=Fusarium sporotrichioides TaxID=5514 RepID=A0A395S2P2_FUSSP|nr:ankyrin repeat [Fusarium sporotrichioides]